MRLTALILLAFFIIPAYGQLFNNTTAQKWADSVYSSLNDDERIGQLIVARLSSMDVKTKKITFLNEQVADYVKKYNIGSICVFQGSPLVQAGYLNYLKSIAKTPILFSIDGEWGVAMRILDSVMPLPKQMMLGAVQDPAIIYQYGKVVAAQCKRLGIQMNYAPVMDVNNNPNNPVINDRSFGEDKYKVALFGTQYMKGMQDNGVMACAKHFPGHGDVAVDSHLDLPVINKSLQQIDSTELFPFKFIFNEGISSVMIAHLFIPSIDDRPNRPTSLSDKNIQGLLRKTIDYQGLTITDGLEMQGVKKFFPNGEASVESIIAGNDLLCLPDSIPMVVEKIKEAINQNRLSWENIEQHCKRVLMAKYQYVLSQNDTIVLNNLTKDLNKDIPAMRRLVAENAITLLSKEDNDFFELKRSHKKNKIAYVAIGIKNDNALTRRWKKEYNNDVYYFDFNKKNADSTHLLINQLTNNYDKIVFGIHQINRAPANNFNISADALSLIDSIQQIKSSLILLFGNAYAVKNWCTAKNLVVCYEDDSIVQNTAIDFLEARLKFKGTLPVTVCERYPYGFGLVDAVQSMPTVKAVEVGINEEKLSTIDSIVQDGINKKAMPGCVVLVAKNGKIVMEKSYGTYAYDEQEKVKTSSVYDLASLTKILSTTLAVMKLYDEQKIDLKKKLSFYLPQLKETNKEKIIIKDLLMHQAGLKPFIPYYKETLDTQLCVMKKFYANCAKDSFGVHVANHLFLRNDCIDSFYRCVMTSEVEKKPKYVYSDNDFILLAALVEKISGKKLDTYVENNFYSPMGLHSIGYHPLNRITYDEIVPSTKEVGFRNQELRGYVHDQGAAIMGGVAGHAGLFSNAADIAAIMQMLLNNGEWKGKKYFNKETVKLFTSYQDKKSRRGLGFDKPERDNTKRNDPYPARAASPETFGHTGFTGTCAWADPKNDLIFIFLSNRIYPEDNGVFKTLNIRPKILETIYQSIEK